MQLIRAYGAYICFIFLLVITASVWFRILSEPKPGELVVAILDVGQGDAIYIKSPSGIDVLIDGGPGSAVLRELPKVMSYGDMTLDAVMATHPDADHIGGLVDLLPRYEIKNFIDSGVPKGSATAAKLQEEISENDIPKTIAYRGMWLDLGKGVRLDILFPDFDVSNIADDKSNDGCIVAKLTYKEASALFACDASLEIESRLVAIASSTELASDVLKVAHHGSKYASGSLFLAAVSPAFAAISAGEGNRYGHPTSEAMNRIEAEGTKIYRTDVNGTVIFVSNGGDFIKK